MNSVPLLRLLFLLSLISITALNFCQAGEVAPYASGFGSSLTADLGWKPDLSLIFNKVNTTSTFRIDEKDSLHLRWRLGSKGTPDSVIVFQDGRGLVGSRSKFDPASKNRLDGELTAAIEIINGTNKLPDAVRLKALSHIQYYSQDRPVDAESWRLCGDKLYKLGDYSSSLQYYDKSLENDPRKAAS
jgi:tetratricopeptide (TPR) repeat protein